MKISLKEDINSLSFFKANFNSVLKRIRSVQRPLIITQNGRSTGVFMDMDTWENYIKTINLMKFVNEGEISLKKDKTYSLDEAEQHFRKKFSL
jgi:prevent-host-death family protein